MKVTKLLDGLDRDNALATDLILYNALQQIDRLEEQQRALKQQIAYYEAIFQKLKDLANVHYGNSTKSFFILFDGVHEKDDEALFADLMELLQLEKPEEESKDEVD